MDDLISRQAAIKDAESWVAVDEYEKHLQKGVIEWLKEFPPAEHGANLINRQTACEYCHEDSDGYVMPLEKNNHAFIRFGMDGWEIDLKANGWHGSAKIRFCPMCGRELRHG